MSRTASTSEAGQSEVARSEAMAGSPPREVDRRWARWVEAKPVTRGSRPRHGDVDGWDVWGPELFEAVPSNFSEIRGLYFKSYEAERLAKDGAPRDYDSVALERQFGRLMYASEPSRFARSVEDVFAACFDIGEGYSWRYPEPEERPYSRPSEGWIAVPVAHFRCGLRLPMHRFVYTIVHDFMKCALCQICPNGMRSITGFIARCAEKGWEPTTRLFWTLFRVSKTSNDGIYDLHWRSTAKCGDKWMKMPTSHRTWHYEYVMVRGGDLAYLPCWAETVRVQLHSLEELTVEDWIRVHDFTAIWREKWPEDIFLSRSFLYEYNCEY